MQNAFSNYLAVFAVLPSCASSRNFAAGLEVSP